MLTYKGDTAILWIHVDDGAICGSSENIFCFIRTSLLKSFEISWSDRLEQIVGSKIGQTERGIFLSQPSLTRSILESNGFMNSRVSTPMVANMKLETRHELNGGIDASKYLLILGSLSYIAIGTRPDISFAVNYLARFLSKPDETHWTALKHLIRYLSGTQNDGIMFEGGHGETDLVVYCDASWGGGILKIHTRFCCIPIWKPNIMGISTTELCGNVNMSCRIYGSRSRFKRIFVDTITAHRYFWQVLYHDSTL